MGKHAVTKKSKHLQRGGESGGKKAKTQFKHEMTSSHSRIERLFIPHDTIFENYLDEKNDT